MIIRCPACQKRYDIAQHIVATKRKYKLRCSNCHTLWEEFIEPSSEPNASRTPPRVVPRAQISNVSTTASTSKSSRPPRSYMPLPKTYSAWHDLIKRYSLDLIILLAAIAVVVMLVIYEGKHIRDFYHTSSFFSPTSASTTGSASTSALPRAATSTTLTKAMELKIENVAFSMIEHEGHPRFIVKGELVNRSSMTLASPDLRVIVRVTCMDNPNEADKLCTLTKWVHPMFGTLIPAGSRQFFQTFAPHPGSIKAQEVEITGVPITTKEGN